MMYKRILVPLEHSGYDRFVLDHVRALAPMFGSSVYLIHVADGWAARNIQQLRLRESEEMRGDLEYIERIAEELCGAGLRAEAILANGDPAEEIAAAAEREHCDLIAMATHGHRFLNDMLRGSVATTLRHITKVPVLMVRGSAEAQPR
jgi:nucleotide-binding universal stress UspA family protein